MVPHKDLGTSLHFAMTVRPRTDAVGLVPDCAVAFRTQTDVLDFLSQGN